MIQQKSVAYSTEMLHFANTRALNSRMIAGKALFFVRKIPNNSNKDGKEKIDPSPVGLGAAVRVHGAADMGQFVAGPCDR